MKVVIRNCADSNGAPKFQPEAIQGAPADFTLYRTKNMSCCFISKMLKKYRAGRKVMVHAICTGWGKTSIEPNIADYRVTINNLAKLVDFGFPIQNCVLCIDQAIPSDEGIAKTYLVLSYAYRKRLLPRMRIRIDVPTNWEELTNVSSSDIHEKVATPTNDKLDELISWLRTTSTTFGFPSNYFETSICGPLALRAPELFIQFGNVSDVDFRAVRMDSVISLPIEIEEIPHGESRCKCGCKHCPYK